jgi:catechol 2,3-dioxygenase-like lactoylglutathione lyase family enzyme
MKQLKSLVCTIALSAAVALPAQSADAPKPATIIGAKIVVTDVQKAEDFYSKLGLKLGVRYHGFEQEMHSENPQAPKLILIINSELPQKRTPGGSSLMILVPDVQATAKALKDAGYPGIGEPKVSAQATALIVKDPDGDEIELLSPPPAK